MGDPVEAYVETLSNLTFNSRPVIMNLTELANDYKASHAEDIVGLIEQRLRKVSVVIFAPFEHSSMFDSQVSTSEKLPCLYLMDSIVKNHPRPYAALFHPRLVSNFAHVFGAVQDVTTRAALYKLRSTWNEVFPLPTLRSLDLRIKQDLDPKWPVAATPSSSKSAAAAAAGGGGSNIHINPAVFKKAKAVKFVFVVLSIVLTNVFYS